MPSKMPNQVTKIPKKVLNRMTMQSYQPTVTQRDAGIVIHGRDIELFLYATAEGRLVVRVIALPSVTGFDRPCRMESIDGASSMLLHEISVTENALSCFAGDQILPSYKVGFTVQLEEGMAEQINIWLPRLWKVSLISHKIEQIIKTALNRPINYLIEFATRSVALIVLNTMSPSDAFNVTRGLNLAAVNDQEFLDQFTTSSVKALLDEASAIAVVSP